MRISNFLFIVFIACTSLVLSSILFVHTYNHIPEWLNFFAFADAFFSLIVLVYLIVEVEVEDDDTKYY